MTTASTDVENDVKDENKIYLKLAVKTFKEKYGNYNENFNHQKYRENIERSKYIGYNLD